jgi:hypothetical protein
MAALPQYFWQQFIDENGNTYSGYKLHFFEPGTSTYKAIFSDAAGSVAYANPLTLDTKGTPPLGPVRLANGSYDVQLALSTDTNPPASPIETIPNIDSTAGELGNVDTIAELEALSEGEFETVNVLGYYTVSDEIEMRTYYWAAGSSATADGGTVITPDTSPATGRWLLKYNSVLNPLWLGAYSDGTNANTTTTAINNSNTAIAADGGGDVVFTDGSYAISSSVAFSAGVRTVFKPGSIVTAGSAYNLTMTGIEASLDKHFDTNVTAIFTDNQCPPLMVNWWGALGDNSTDDTIAIQAAIDQAKTNSNTLKFPNGIYRVSTINFEEVQNMDFYFDNNCIIRGNTTGTDVVLIKNDSDLCKECTWHGLYVDSINGTTYTNGIRLLGLAGSPERTVTDLAFYNTRVIGGSGVITNAMTLDDFAFNNNFYNTELKADGKCLNFGSNNVNVNLFAGGRFRGNDNTTTIGVSSSSTGNKFLNIDISNCKYAINGKANRGVSYDSCYFEGHGTAIIGFGNDSGNFDGAQFNNCFFTGSTIWDSPQGSAAHRDISFTNCYIKDIGASTDAFTTDVKLQGFYFRNNFFEGTIQNKWSNAWDKDFHIIDGDTEYKNGVKSYSLNLGATTGPSTEVIDSVTNLCDDEPALVHVTGIGRDDATNVKSFFIEAAIGDDGTLTGSTIIGDISAGIGAVQVSAGNLQVTTLGTSNWNFYVKSYIWAD